MVIEDVTISSYKGKTLYQAPEGRTIAWFKFMRDGSVMVRLDNGEVVIKRLQCGDKI